MTQLGLAAAHLLRLARDGRPRPAIDLALDLLASGVGAVEIIVDLLAPVQREVGARWEANEWSTADEHAATAVMDGVLGALAFHAPAPDGMRGRVLVACAEGEHHTMPARMGAELLRGDGWDVTFLGGSLPADDLQRYAAVTEPDAVVISCTVPLFLPGARRCFAAITELGLRAVAAGAAFGADDRRALRLGANARIDPTADLAAALSDLHATQAPTRTPPEVYALELAADELRRSCLSALRARVPRLATSAPWQLAALQRDVGDVLDHLTAAIDVGDDTVFADFVQWQSHVGQVRGREPADHDWLLGIIGDVLAVAGMHEAARLCATQRPADTTS